MFWNMYAYRKGVGVSRINLVVFVKMKIFLFSCIFIAYRFELSFAKETYIYYQKECSFKCACYGIPNLMNDLQ